MTPRTGSIVYLLVLVASAFPTGAALPAEGPPDARGERLTSSSAAAGLWWASSGWKVNAVQPLPATPGDAVLLKAARNEAEAAQLVVRPEKALRGFGASAAALEGPGGAVIPAVSIEVLRVRFVNVAKPTDATGSAGPWPDPLPPFRGPVDLEAGRNQPLWVRVKVPRDARPGDYTGSIRLTAEGFREDVPLKVHVFDFALPDRMTCTTAFGFSPQNVWRYQRATDPGQRREVLEKYWDSFAAHHISPYDPAPLDPFQVRWPELKGSPPADVSAPKVELDWKAWDAAMERAMNAHHFTSFALPVHGMGGGTFHSRVEPGLQGHGEGTPEYKALFDGYWRTVEAHLREKGWLDRAFVYWFDEPDPKDYDFVMNGFRKLKEAAPGIHRMLTEQVESKLAGGPDIWCPISNAYGHEAAEKRRVQGERFWWYVCTGPKAPFATLFIDHAATELRVWLWQTWQRKIDGILVWQSNYWTSECAYPDPERPQDPYEDPMGWVSGYDTPKGTRSAWGNGDGRFIYPPETASSGRQAGAVLEGPVDSIRWEMLRDGIEDYEYLAILRGLLRAKGSSVPDAEREQLAKLLDVPEAITKDMKAFTMDPGPIEARRAEVAGAIERLAKVAVAAEQPANAPDPLVTLRAEHPRLFVTRGDMERVKAHAATDPIASLWRQRLDEEAKEMLLEPPVEHKLIGPRLLHQSRAALRRIGTLAGLYLLDGDRAKAERARVEMLAAAAFPDWNPSHFLDTAEMTAALAIGYDWLFEILAPADRAAVRAAIIEKGLRQGMRAYESRAGWTRARHNWSQVCNGGLTVGALAIADEEPDLAGEIVRRARESIEIPMRQFAPDGGCEEGPGYWNYATRYNVFYLSALQTALGTDLGLKSMAGFAETGLFRIHSTGPLGLTFNYADAGEGAGSAAQMLWLARELKRPEYARHEEKTARHRPEIFHLLWDDAAGALTKDVGPSRDVPLDAFFRGVNVAFFRGAWDDPKAVYAGLKGGDNRANHAHLDLGTFVIDALGERWAVDLGPDDYNLPGYFGKERWGYYRLRTEGQNTLVIGGRNQAAGAKAPIVAFLSTAARAFAVADLTAAYAPGAKRVLRGLALLDRRRVLVEDEVDLRESEEVLWSLHTRAVVDLEGARATLSGRKAKMEARILSPEGASFEVLSAARPPPEGRLDDVKKLAIRLRGVATARIAVWMAPAGDALAAPPLEPLDAWIAAR